MDHEKVSLLLFAGAAMAYGVQQLSMVQMILIRDDDKMVGDGPFLEMIGNQARMTFPIIAFALLCWRAVLIGSFLFVDKDTVVYSLVREQGCYVLHSDLRTFQQSYLYGIGFGVMMLVIEALSSTDKFQLEPFLMFLASYFVESLIFNYALRREANEIRAQTSSISMV